VRNMSEDPIEIGLSPMSEDEIESLAEQCEIEVSTYLLKLIPQKSIDEFQVTCILEMSEKLNVDIIIDISQKYTTSESLDALVNEAIEFGMNWLEKRLREMNVERP